MRWGVGMAPEYALITVCGAVFGVLLWWRWRLGSREAVAVLPPGLRAARLVFAESLFRSGGEVSITARVDRVYRNAAGVLVLVELKTRHAHRSHWSDVIELSAQRVAVMGQTGQAVAKHAYVLTETPGGRRSGSHRVELMAAEDVMALALRRESLLRGAKEAHRTRVPGLCRTCPFVAECGLPRSSLLDR